MEVFANYQTERDAFQSLLDPDCKKQIQLFRGESGTGKTSLMMMCQGDVCEPVYQVPINFKGTSVNIAEIFWRTGSKLGWDRLPKFTKQISSLAGISVDIAQNEIKGNQNQINVVLQSDDKSDRDIRLAALTDAWFEDFQNLDQLLLIIMDTYEHAGAEIQEWINGPFLTRASHTNKIRIAVAGQKVPDKNNIEWGHCCNLNKLYGVREALHWLPVLDDLDRVIPVDPPLTWLAGICHAMDGRPDEIMKIIQALPKKN